MPAKRIHTLVFINFILYISNICILLRLANSFVTELRGWGLGRTVFQEQTRAKGTMRSAECLRFLLPITDITIHSTRRVGGRSE